MIAVRVEIDDTALHAILDAIVPPAIDDVAAAALNDAITEAKDKTTEILVPMMGLPANLIEQACEVRRAERSSLAAQLIVSGKAIKMIVFEPTWTREGGVVLQIAGKQEEYHHAFIRTVRHGHVGVFERRGPNRLPIRELYGPSVPGMMARTDVLPVVTAKIQEDLPAALANQVTRAARKAGQ